VSEPMIEALAVFLAALLVLVGSGMNRRDE
jgi:hypothetical protein